MDDRQCNSCGATFSPNGAKHFRCNACRFPERILKVCACGNPITRAQRAKTCSAVCANKASHAAHMTRKARAKASRDARACARTDCAKPFVQSHLGQKYCCAECQIKHNHRNAPRLVKLDKILRKHGLR